MRRLAAASLLLLLGIAPAAAQPRAAACTAPPGPLQATICGDAALRAADARLRAAERAASAGTARPATLAIRAEGWQRRLEAGDTATTPRPLNRDELLDEYRERTSQLDDLVRQDRSIRRLEVQRCPDGRRDCPPNPVFARPAGLERNCLGAALRNCRVGAAGIVASEDRNTRILFQIQHGFTDSDGLRAGIVLMAETRGGWRLVGWSFEGVSFTPPRLVETDDGLMLHAEGRTGGSGNGNADLFYRQSPQGWVEVESESWWAALPGRLPAGLTIMQGVDYDLESLSARSPLWREEDGNCCPRGGQARLEFRVRERALILAAVTLDAVARAQQPSVDSCPAERATYRFTGEGEFTAELRREPPAASAESDLLLRLRSAATTRDYWFRFTQSQGYGTQYILPVAAPTPDGTRDLETEDDTLPLMAFHGVQQDLSVMETPPRSGQPAPRHLFLPGLGQALWYGQVPGTPTNTRESLRPGFWTLSACR